MKKAPAGKALAFPVSLLAFLTLAGVLTVCFPAPRVSARENRILAAPPVFSADGILNGHFFSEADAYFAERFPGRDALLSLRAAAALAGNTFGEDVILCRDGSLSRRVPLSDAAARKNASAAVKFSETVSVPVVSLILPCRLLSRREVLPRTYSPAGEQAAYEALLSTFPQAVSYPAKVPDGAWFRTDHHYTQEGAYLAYLLLAPALGYEPMPRSFFRPETVTEDFLGTSASAACLPNVAPDKITLWRCEGDERYSLTRDGEPAGFSGLYDLEKLAGNDRYAVFCGGNCGTLEITAGEGDERPQLLLFRDSFADALLPFLALHFRVTAVDLRYGKRDVGALCADVSEILFCFGMQTVLSDGNLLAPLRQRAVT